MCVLWSPTIYISELNLNNVLAGQMLLLGPQRRQMRFYLTYYKIAPMHSRKNK